MKSLQRGKTLITSRTRHWTNEEIRDNDRVESSRLYTNFTSDDAGRSRLLVCSMNDQHPDYDEYVRLFMAAPVLKTQLTEKRREVIDLAAELDRAKREVNSLEYLRKEDNNLINAQWKNIEELKTERDIAGRATVEIAFKLANAEKELSESLSNFHYLQNRSIALVDELTQHIEERERGDEAWQEKVDSLELELGTKHIYNWYLKPVFMFCAGATTAIVAVTWWIRWYL